MKNGQIPIEVLERVVDELALSKPDLCALALTSRQLIPRCRYHLYAQITWTTRQSYSYREVTKSDLALLDTLCSSAAICSQVTSIVMPSSRHPTGDIFLDPLCKITPYLTNVVDIGFENWVWDRVSSSLRTCLLSPTFTNVVELRLVQCVFPLSDQLRALLLSFKSLRHLDLDVVAALRGSRASLLQHEEATLDLDTLKCSGMDARALWRSFALIRTGALYLDSPGSATPAELDGMLSIVQSTLRLVALDLRSSLVGTSNSFASYPSLSFTRFPELRTLSIHFDTRSTWSLNEVLDGVGEHLKLHEIRIYTDPNTIMSISWEDVILSLRRPAFSSLRRFAVYSPKEGRSITLSSLSCLSERGILEFIEDPGFPRVLSHKWWQ